MVTDTSGASSFHPVSISNPSVAISVALRQSATLLGVNGLCVVRRSVDGGVVVVASHGQAGDEDTLTTALALIGGGGALAFPGTGGWVGATPLGETEHLLVSFSKDPLDDGDLTDAARLVRALLHEHEPDVVLDPVRFVGDLASMSAPLSDLLDLALQRATDGLRMEAAVLLCVEAESWRVEAVYDPGTVLVLDDLLATDGLATMTYRANGTVGLHEVSVSDFAPIESVGAYLGAPIVSGRHGLGVLAFVSRDPQVAPFSEQQRDLVQMLARWAGVGLGAQGTTRRLADAETTLARILEGSPHPIGTAEWVATDGTLDDLLLLEVNDPAVRLLGIGPGDRLSDALPVATLRLWTAACRRALEDGAPQPFRTEVVAPGESEPRRLAVTLGLVAEPTEEHPARVSFLAEDVTSRLHLRAVLREREAQLRTLLETASVVLFELDEAGRFTFAEGRALALSGVRSQDLLGVSVFERYRLNPATTQAVGRVLAGEPASWSLKLGRREFEVVAVPATDPEGHIHGARGVATDVTERNIARRSAADATAEAAEDARYSADLMALLSHGLRQPLATTLGFADLLEAEGDEETRIAGAAIARAASDILDTLDGFLDLSQLSALRTASPTPVGEPGLLAALQTALAEGTTDTAVSLDLAPLDVPVLLHLGLLRASVRRLAVLATDTLDVRAEVDGGQLLLQFESPELGSRLAADSLHTAYVYHAASALGAELVLTSDHIVGIGVPYQEAPIVQLKSLMGDGADRAATLA